MQAEPSGTVVVRPLFCGRDRYIRDAPPWMAGQGRQGTGMSPVDRFRTAAVCISRSHKTASLTEQVQDGLPAYEAPLVRGDSV